MGLDDLLSTQLSDCLANRFLRHTIGEKDLADISEKDESQDSGLFLLVAEHYPVQDLRVHRLRHADRQPEVGEDRLDALLEGSRTVAEAHRQIDGGDQADGHRLAVPQAMAGDRFDGVGEGMAEVEDGPAIPVEGILLDDADLHPDRLGNDVLEFR